MGLEVEIKAEIARTKEAKKRIVRAVADGTFTNDEAAAQMAGLRRKEQRLERELIKLSHKEEIRADFLAAMEALRNQDIEVTLAAMLKKQPQTLGRLLRLIFRSASIVVQGDGYGAGRVGVLKAYEFTPDFAELVGSAECGNRFSESFPRRSPLLLSTRNG